MPTPTFRCPASHKHDATISCYRTHGCRCDRCRRKNRDQGRVERKRAAYGRTVPPVDAAPARARIEELAATMSLRGIARESGMTQATIQRIRNGATRTVKVGTLDRLMEVNRPNLKPFTLINSTPTVRRFQALAVLGWSAREVGERAGLDGRYTFKMLNKPHCRAATAEAVARVYDELWATPPTPTTKHERSAVAKTRARAARNGWVPPLAWDDIDDVDETPSVPDVVQLKGERVLEDAEWLLEAGETPEQVARILGRTAGSIGKLARHHHRPDIATHFYNAERLEGSKAA